MASGCIHQIALDFISALFDLQKNLVSLLISAHQTCLQSLQTPAPDVMEDSEEHSPQGRASPLWSHPPESVISLSVLPPLK